MVPTNWNARLPRNPNCRLAFRVMLANICSEATNAVSAASQRPFSSQSNTVSLNSALSAPVRCQAARNTSRLSSGNLSQLSWRVNHGRQPNTITPVKKNIERGYRHTNRPLQMAQAPTLQVCGDLRRSNQAPITAEV